MTEPQPAMVLGLYAVADGEVTKAADVAATENEEKNQ